jgi:hypothetical protein
MRGESSLRSADGRRRIIWPYGDIAMLVGLLRLSRNLRRSPASAGAAVPTLTLSSTPALRSSQSWKRASWITSDQLLIRTAAECNRDKSGLSEFEIYNSVA